MNNMLLYGYVLEDHDVFIEYSQDPEYFGLEEDQTFDFFQYQELLEEVIREEFPQIRKLYFYPNHRWHITTTTDFVDTDRIMEIIEGFSIYDKEFLFS